jgi:hypothetical protein
MVAAAAVRIMASAIGISAEDTNAMTVAVSHDSTDTIAVMTAAVSN